MTASGSLLAELRPVAFAIAYRMLSSVSEAEDIVQEALLALHLAQEGGDAIASPRAFVITVATRLAINELRSARVRRETYVGEWLPEPILTDSRSDPEWQVGMAESVSVGMLALLENLSPEQRAVLLLRDIFDYSYREIVPIVDRSESTIRQLAARARRYLLDGKPRFPSTPERRDALASAFFTAIDRGDLKGLEALLANDVVLTGDGGGKAPALARSVHGRDPVIRAVGGWFNLARRLLVIIRQTEVNGGPGALLLDQEGRLFCVVALEIVDNQVAGIGVIANPDKLERLGPLADFSALAT